MQHSHNTSLDDKDEKEIDSKLKENKKRTIVLKESELRNLITNSIKNILYERRSRR